MIVLFQLGYFNLGSHELGDVFYAGLALYVLFLICLSLTIIIRKDYKIMNVKRYKLKFISFFISMSYCFCVYNSGLKDIMLCKLIAIFAVLQMVYFFGWIFIKGMNYIVGEDLK